MKEPPIYWTDPMKMAHDTSVSSCIQNQEHFVIVIANHVVRPEGGGQAGDRGLIITNGKPIRFRNNANMPFF